MATTPVDDHVIAVMNQHMGLSGCFGNAASNTHAYGFAARKAVEDARQQVSNLIVSKPHEIVWTSGATESNNLAIKGAYQFYKAQGKHIVTSETEHKATLDTCAALADEGAEITYIRPKKNGLVNIDLLEKAIRSDTLLVSLTHVNNEIGVFHDLKSLGKLIKSKGALFHVDAAQSAGKIKINVDEMKIDLLSLSGHKLYGPKGIGALYVRAQPRIFLKPLIHGGGHELGLRSGTLATHQIAGMGEAFRIAQATFNEAAKKINMQAQKIISCLQSITGVYINGDLEQRYLGNINFRVAGVNGDALLFGLAPLAVSNTSACTASQQKPSHVLTALGLTEREALDSIRLSIGRYTTDEEIDFICQHLLKTITQLKQLSPCLK